MPKGTVFLFAGFNGNIMGVKARNLMEVLAAKGFTSHCFNDGGQTLFLEGGDNFASIADMDAFIAENRDPVGLNIGLSSSGGGFMGIRQAIRHDFDMSFGLGAFTTFDEAMYREDGRGKSIEKKLHAMEPDDAKRNLNHDLRDSQFRGRIVLMYADKNAGDVYQAENIRAYPQVKLVPVDSHKHGFVKDLSMGRQGIWKMVSKELKAAA